VIEPVSLVEAKQHLNIDNDFLLDDDLITGFIGSARLLVEGFLSRALVTQTWELRLDMFPFHRQIMLPRPRLQAVNSITYYDSSNTSTTLTASVYQVDIYAEPGYIVLASGQSWPVTYDRINALLIEYDAGYGDNAVDVPESIRQAMKLLIGHWYLNRETAVIGRIVNEVPFAVQSLLWPERIVLFS